MKRPRRLRFVSIAEFWLMTLRNKRWKIYLILKKRN